MKGVSFAGPAGLNWANWKVTWILASSANVGIKDFCTIVPVDILKNGSWQVNHGISATGLSQLGHYGFKEKSGSLSGLGKLSEHQKLHLESAIFVKKGLEIDDCKSVMGQGQFNSVNRQTGWDWNCPWK